MTNTFEQRFRNNQGLDMEELGFTEGAEEQLQRNHPVIYQFIKRLEQARPDCLYLQLQRGDGK